MKLGVVKIENYVISRKGHVSCTTEIVGGVEVSNVKEIVINNIKHEKNADGSWTQHGRRRDIKIDHEVMVRKVQNADLNRKRFDVWASGYTINIKDKKLNDGISYTMKIKEASPKPSNFGSAKDVVKTTNSNPPSYGIFK